VQCHPHDAHDVYVAIAIQVVARISVRIRFGHAPSAGYLPDVHHIHIAIAVKVAQDAR